MKLFPFVAVLATALVWPLEGPSQGAGGRRGGGRGADQNPAPSFTRPDGQSTEPSSSDDAAGPGTQRPNRRPYDGATGRPQQGPPRPGIGEGSDTGAESPAITRPGFGGGNRPGRPPG